MHRIRTALDLNLVGVDPDRTRRQLDLARAALQPDAGLSFDRVRPADVQPRALDRPEWTFSTDLDVLAAHDNLVGVAVDLIASIGCISDSNVCSSRRRKA
jgi:hypothetical protein